jgi:hypothetical protein
MIRPATFLHLYRRAHAAAAGPAAPGDANLDLHLTGLRVRDVVVADVAPRRVDVVITFDTSQARGWWDGVNGERVTLDVVDEFQACFGLRLLPGVRVLDQMVDRLQAWRAAGTDLAMTSAPGRDSMLSAAGYRSGGIVVVPREATGDR